MMFEDLLGRQLTWADSLSQTYTDGIIVMHRGKPVYERYFEALQPQRPYFACFSVTKSLCGRAGGNAASQTPVG